MAVIMHRVRNSCNPSIFDLMGCKIQTFSSPLDIAIDFWVLTGNMRRIFNAVSL